MTTTFARYQRIAPLYDLLDLPFEWRRYRALRPLLFQDLGGRLLDAGIGTGRNCAYYPPGADVAGIDTSPAMLARARRRCPTVVATGQLHLMDVTALRFSPGSFDAAVASFLFCVLPDDQQAPALCELGRAVKPRRNPVAGIRPANGHAASLRDTPLAALDRLSLWRQLRSANGKACCLGRTGNHGKPLSRRWSFETADAARTCRDLRQRK